jgi:hypothetical protein
MCCIERREALQTQAWFQQVIGFGNCGRSARALCFRPRGDMNAVDINSTELRARELLEFSNLLRSPVSKPQLRKWISVSPLRTQMFADWVWGSIRWPKSLGRPAGNTLAGGFVIKHEWYFEIFVIGRRGEVIEKNGWMEGDAPSVWDAPEQPDHWQVYYFFKAGKDNRLEVSFSNQGWVDSSPLALASFRGLNPKGFEFPSDGGFTVLPPIAVERRHFIAT